MKHFWPSILEDDLEIAPFHESSGLSVFEDDKGIHVEAALPGMNLDEIEINYEKGMLLIQADKKEESEDKNKKFYRKAHRSYCYSLTVPGKVDENREPTATYLDGVLKVSFQKARETTQKKRIAINRG